MVGKLCLGRFHTPMLESLKCLQIWVSRPCSQHTHRVSMPVGQHLGFIIDSSLRAFLSKNIGQIQHQFSLKCSYSGKKKHGIFFLDFSSFLREGEIKGTRSHLVCFPPHSQSRKLLRNRECILFSLMLHSPCFNMLSNVAGIYLLMVGHMFVSDWQL